MTILCSPAVKVTVPLLDGDALEVVVVDDDVAVDEEHAAIVAGGVERIGTRRGSVEQAGEDGNEIGGVGVVGRGKRRAGAAEVEVAVQRRGRGEFRQAGRQGADKGCERRISPQSRCCWA